MNLILAIVLTIIALALLGPFGALLAVAVWAVIKMNK